MLDCLGTKLLSMVTTAYERASKEMRDAFVYQIEQNTAKHSPPQHVYWEEKAVPGDILVETIFKFIDVTLQLKPKTPFEDQSQQINNRRQAGIRLEHVGCMVATETEVPTMEDIAQRFRNLKIHQTGSMINSYTLKYIKLDQ